MFCQFYLLIPYLQHQYHGLRSPPGSLLSLFWRQIDLAFIYLYQLTSAPSLNISGKLVRRTIFGVISLSQKESLRILNVINFTS